MVFLKSSDKMYNQQHLSLHSIDTYFEPFLNSVLSKDRLGVGWGVIKLDSIFSSCGKTKGDSFKLSIPYAGQNLVWNVLFDSQYPELGPDFIFSDETFLMDPDIENLSRYVPSLAKWDYKNNNALLKVIVELLSYYKEHQVQLLKKQGQRLNLEYSMLIETVPQEDIEVILLPMGTKPIEAYFSIRLDIDFSQLPTRINQSQNDAAMLLVTFCGPDWNCVVPNLYLSQSLEETFSGAASLHIPPFLPNSYLTAYIPKVKELIMDKINTIVQCYESRKKFVSALLLLQRDSIIEYDAVEFHDITLLLEHRDFYFLVHFHLTSMFPMEKPSIKLQSVYHMTAQGNLYSEELNNNYNCSIITNIQRWNPRQMISKILMYIIEKEVPKFQEKSTKNNRF
uniref:BRISC and BRCA1-A complex member 2-like n=1 Tax=Vespula vulgaris TaxID=7454 RepID=UPI00213857C8|nr:BRISC and BRCA1-A complex member 2-like [Vespula vulgaris]XP_050854994.1 BRISC and BRCA1-A complex member 2-like [Vespula vulgaris]XP_050854996.1 BRISC and BRCA1-A complex member 2-like [Vespula vulgaris]